MNKGKKNNVNIKTWGIVCVSVLLIILAAVVIDDIFIDKYSSKNIVLKLLEKEQGELNNKDLLYGLLLQYIYDSKNIEIECDFDNVELKDLNDFYYYELRRVSEKEDLDCIDRFIIKETIFVPTAYNLLSQIVNYQNLGCILIDEKNNENENTTSYILKCPLNNCKKKEVLKKVMIEKPYTSIFNNKHGFLFVAEKFSASCKFKINK